MTQIAPTQDPKKKENNSTVVFYIVYKSTAACPGIIDRTDQGDNDERRKAGRCDGIRQKNLLKKKKRRLSAEVRRCPPVSAALRDRQVLSAGDLSAKQE